MRSRGHHWTANVALGQFPTVPAEAELSVQPSASACARARHIRRKLKARLKLVDNLGRKRLNLPREQGRKASSQNGEDGGEASAAAGERRGTAAIARR